MKLAGNLKRLVLGAAMSLAAFSAASAESWKFAVEEGPGDVQTLYAQEFKRLVEARTKGQVKVTIYTYGQLGSENDITELTAGGAIQFSNASPGHLGTFVPEVQVLSLPFLLPDSDKAKADVLSNSQALYGSLAKDFAGKGSQAVYRVSRRRDDLDDQEGDSQTGGSRRREVPRHDFADPHRAVQALRRQPGRPALGRGLWWPADERHPGAGQSGLLHRERQVPRSHRSPHLCARRGIHHHRCCQCRLLAGSLGRAQEDARRSAQRVADLHPRQGAREERSGGREDEEDNPSSRPCASPTPSASCSASVPSRWPASW